MWSEPIEINWSERQKQLELAANPTFESFFLPGESLTWGFQVRMKVELWLEEGESVLRILQFDLLAGFYYGEFLFRSFGLERIRTQH